MKTILIDLWGTLLASSDVSTVNDIIKKFNIQMKHHDFIILCDKQGLFSKTVNSLQIWESIMIELDRTKDDAAEANTIWIESSQSVKLFPKTKEFLIELKQRGYSLVLASAIGRDSYEILNKRFQFNNYFDHTLPTFTMGMGKCVEYYEKICERLNINPSETCMIGDNLYFDIVPAIKAGLQAIFLNRYLLTSYEKEHIPKKTIKCRSYEDILNCIDEL